MAKHVFGIGSARQLGIASDPLPPGTRIRPQSPAGRAGVSGGHVRAVALGD